MTREEVQRRLYAAGEEEYRRFSQALAPSAHPLIGVRTPAVRALGKEIAKGDWREYLSSAEDETYEELLLQGFIIGYASMPVEERLDWIRKFVPRIDGWAVCDCVCSTFVAARKYPALFWDFILPYLDDDNPWAVRFGIVMLMDYFIDDEHIDRTLELLGNVKSDFYYVQMGAGWALSVCFVKYRDKTLRLLQNGSVQPEIRRKAIQKCIESFRVDTADKALLRELRANLKV
jgi:3-methyladenine DNA glycosylase AlkD